MDKYSIVLFHSTNHGMWAAKALKTNDIERKMIPIPKHLSSDCGYCMRIKTEDTDKVIEILEEKNIDYDKIVVNS